MPVHSPTTSHGVFPATRWTLISQMQEGSPTAEHRAALATICQTYWYPLYVYARRFGKNEDDARDAVQECFAHLIAGNHLRDADPLRGRLRSFLLTVLKNTILQEHERQSAQSGAAGWRRSRLICVMRRAAICWSRCLPTFRPTRLTSASGR